MFTNRYSELKLLNDEYVSNNFAFTILYGRRRVGKTTLIKEFIKDKPAIYFLATLENFSVVLKRFQLLVAEFLNDNFLKELQLRDFKQLFEYIGQKNFSQKLVIIIDEFQYLGKLDESIASQFQLIVDEILKNKNIHLILCGSIISMMYEQTLSYSSPLYGRRTSQIKLEAINFEYLKEFFPSKSQNELIELYAVLYGVPKYLEMFSDSGEILNSIEANILNPNSYLYNEPQFILQNEVNEPVTYFSILEAIANGEHKLGSIASRLGKNVQNITSFIAKLTELDIIYKEVPILEDNPAKSKKGLYFIKDNFFRFWFCYVLPYKSQLELGNTNYVRKKIAENFNGFISPVYEQLCIEYLLKNYELLKCGRHWDKDLEIDAIGISKDYIILAECKYSNKKVGVDILEQLKQKASRLNSNLAVKHYILFSKCGFTDELKKIKSDEVVLVENIQFKI